MSFEREQMFTLMLQGLDLKNPEVAAKAIRDIAAALDSQLAHMVAQQTSSATISAAITSASGSSLYPAFSADKDGVAQAVIPNTFVDVTFLNEVFDTNNDFSNSRFTPSVRGKALLFAAVRYQTFPDNRTVQIAIAKNGARNKNNYFHSAAAGGPGQIATMVAFIFDANGETDYFEVQSWHSAVGSENISGGVGDTYFGGILIPSSVIEGA